MIIWSFQPKSLLLDLEKNGVYHADFNKSAHSEFEEFINSYNWLMGEMDARFKRPENATTPIWGWSKNCESTSSGRPDLRKHNFYNNDYILLELDIPEERLLESCFDKWHCVLNNFPYIPNEYLESLTDEEFENLMEEERSYTREYIEETWKNIFDVTDSCCTQVTFWELFPEDIKKTYPINRSKR